MQSRAAQYGIYDEELSYSPNSEGKGRCLELGGWEKEVVEGRWERSA